MVVKISVYGVVRSTVEPSNAPFANAPNPRKSSISVALTVLVVVLLLLTLLFCFLSRRKIHKLVRQWRRTNKDDDEELFVRRFEMEELLKATNNFSQDCLLGSGGFGSVYRGILDAEVTVAIKKPHADSYQSVQEFRNEVKLLSKVKHKNLLALVGYCEEPGARGAKMLVYEFVPNGSLLEYIMGRRGKDVLTWRQRVTLAIGVAKGIDHLHNGVKPSIIHRDIKPSNILIGEGLEPKVSDFGLVRSGPGEDQSHVSSQVKGTPGYLDPAYCTTLHLTPFSDVYSFGVILLQLVAARPAVDTTRNNSNYHIIGWARPSLERGEVEEILDANLLTEPCNTQVMLKMGQLALRCVAHSPKHRPTMSQVAEELEQALYEEAGTGLNCRRSQGGEPLESSVMEEDSFVSVYGVRLQKFRMDMDSISFQSGSLRCLESNTSNSIQ